MSLLFGLPIALVAYGTKCFFSSYQKEIGAAVDKTVDFYQDNKDVINPIAKGVGKTVWKVVTNSDLPIDTYPSDNE